MTKILNAYYTNDIKDNINVTYESDEDGVYEMNIEPGSAEAIEAENQGWTEEAILTATAENKRAQMYDITEAAKLAASDVYTAELKDALKRKVEVEALHKRIVEQHKNDIKKMMQRQVEAEALHKTIAAKNQNDIKKMKQRLVEAEALVISKEKQMIQRLVEAEALVKSKEKELIDTTQKVNNFIKNTLSTEDKEAGMEKVIEFLSALDTEEVVKKLKDANVI